MAKRINTIGYRGKLGVKILWMSDSPTSPSGFGNVTRFVCSGLADRGHHVHILGWQAHGEPTTWQNCTLYPVRLDRFGADVLLNYLYRLRPELLITLSDVWWLTYIANPGIATFMRTAGIPWVLYYPIDGDMGNGRLPPSWVNILRTVDLPVAMSRYGKEVSEANGVRPAYVPHGVDCTVFKPPSDKTAAKAALGYEGRFVILSDARNQPRKLLPRLLEIFRRFSAGKDDVLLHLHCDPDDPAAQSPEYQYNLMADASFLGLSDKIRITAGMSIAKGVSLSELAAIYSASDVHLLASWGEGFGLPTLQAAANGVVPMASDYTASRELTSGHGEALRIKTYIPDEFGILRALIDIDDTVDKLERFYHDRALLETKSEASARFGSSYDWRTVVDQWNGMLTQEVPRARQHASRTPPVSRVTILPNVPAGPSRLTQIVRQALPDMPGATVTLNVTESKPGELVGELFRDAARSDQRITLPVSLPAPGAALTKGRTPGLVYLAGARDKEVFELLWRLFPGLSAWSPVEMALGTDPKSEKPIKTTVVTGQIGYRRALVETTLALDLEGVDPELPVRAAEFGVPCIRADVGEQPWLWPGLSVTGADIGIATELARTMLTDQGEALSACARARERLTSRIAEPGRRIC